MASNRETVRDAMATLLENALVGNGLPVQAVYNHQSGDFANQSPVIEVVSDGTQRFSLTSLGSRATFYLAITTFVLYSDGGNWNEDDALDALDDIESLIAGIFDGATARKSSSWSALTYAGPSQISSWIIGGLPYIGETIKVAVEVNA